MSAANTATSKRLTIPELQRRKGGAKIVMLTAYDALMAGLLDEAADVLLVGDSLGMVRLGFDTTLPVTLDMMILHAQAVMRGSQRACVLVDMPFATVQESPARAFRHAARVMAETGCAGVKIEGGLEMVETVRFLVQRGVPVMAHIGLKPQHVQAMGGFKQQARDEAGVALLLEEARAMEAAGAFGLLLEGVPETAAQAVTHGVGIPTIGIGAGRHCDGQVLVSEDMLGMTQRVPGFVVKQAELGNAVSDAAEAYARWVQEL